MNRILLVSIMVVFISVLVNPAWAGNATLPYVFTPDTPAKADSVNGNFSALAAEVNDNDSRLTALESAPAVATSQSCISGIVEGIDSMGELLCADPVRFGVRRDDTYVHGGSIQKVPFGHDHSTVWTNVGNAFDQTTGTFTAPANGLYVFSGAVCFDVLTPGDSIEFFIYAGEKAYESVWMQATGTTHVVSTTATAYLTTGQTAELVTVAPALTGFCGAPSNALWTWFTGARVR